MEQSVTFEAIIGDMRVIGPFASLQEAMDEVDKVYWPPDEVYVYASDGSAGAYYNDIDGWTVYQ